MIQTCAKCGSLNEASSERCCFCEEPLENHTANSPAAANARAKASDSKREPAEAASSVPPWRAEVAERLRGYRARRRGATTGLADDEPDSQVALPFVAEEEAVPLAEDSAPLDEELEDPLQATLSSAAARVQETSEHLLIDVSRPPVSETPGVLLQGARSSIHDRVAPAVPVAGLGIRRRAAMIDVLCLLLAFSGVLSLYVALGGKLLPSKLDLGVAVAALFLLYLQYFTLFTVMGGATPGMMFTGLRLVTFDAGPPEPAHLLRRSFGYFISGVAALLGFFWALWDEDQLTWHDRISQTFLARAESLATAPGDTTHAPSMSTHS